MSDFLREGHAEPQPTSDPGSSANVRASEGTPDSPGGPASEGAKRKKKRELIPTVMFTRYYGALFLLLISVFIGAEYLFVLPKFKGFKMIDAETRATASVLEEERHYLDALSRSINAAQGIPEDVYGRIDEAIPRDAGIPKLLFMMASIAKSSGVELENVQFSGAPPLRTESGDVPKFVLAPTLISATLSSKGYQSMRSYLANLQKSLRILDVNSISVSSGVVEDQNGRRSSERTFSYLLQITAYSIEKNVRSPAATAAAPASAEE